MPPLRFRLSMFSTLLIATLAACHASGVDPTPSAASPDAGPGPRPDDEPANPAPARDNPEDLIRVAIPGDSSGTGVLELGACKDICSPTASCETACSGPAPTLAEPLPNVILETEDTTLPAGTTGQTSVLTTCGDFRQCAGPGTACNLDERVTTKLTIAFQQSILTIRPNGASTARFELHARATPTSTMWTIASDESSERWGEWQYAYIDDGLFDVRSPHFQEGDFLRVDTSLNAIEWLHGGTFGAIAAVNSRTTLSAVEVRSESSGGFDLVFPQSNFVHDLCENSLGFYAGTGTGSFLHVSNLAHWSAEKRAGTDYFDFWRVEQFREDAGSWWTIDTRHGTAHYGWTGGTLALNTRVVQANACSCE